MGKAEGYVENYLKKEANKRGFLCMKFTSPGTSGVPDRILIGHNLTFFVETKSNVGSLRELQKEVIHDMQKHGATVFVAHTREEVDELFNQLERE